MKDLSVCISILNYNGWSDTIECIKSILRSNYRAYQIVVVDNFSTDGSPEKIISWFKMANLNFVRWDGSDAFGGAGVDFNEVVLIKAAHNRGYAAGNNLGLRYAMAKNFSAVWILNNDTEVLPDTLSNMVEKLKEDDMFGIVGCKIYHYARRDVMQCDGGYLLDRLTGRVSAVFDFKQYEKVNSTANRYLLFNTGASFLMRTNALDHIGLLNEDYFIYFEEPDLTVKVLRSGFKVTCASNAIVFHKEGATIQQDSPKEKRSLLSDYYTLRNRIVFAKNNNPRYLVPIYLSVVFAFLKRAVKGDWQRSLNAFKILLRPSKHFEGITTKQHGK